jgi:hypothetical protein
MVGFGFPQVPINPQDPIQFQLSQTLSVNDVVKLTSNGQIRKYITGSIGANSLFASTIYNISGCVLSSSSFAVCYNLAGLSYVVIGTISGTTTTIGTPVVYLASGAITNSTIISLTSTSFAISYLNTNNNYGYAIVGTVSGTTITLGTAVAFNSSVTSSISAIMLSSSSIVLTYLNSNGFGYSVVGTVVGTVISFATAVQFTSAVTSNVSMGFSSSTVFVISYLNSSNSYGYAVIGTVTGTVIAFGTAVAFNSATTSNISLSLLPGTTIAIAYLNSSNSYGYAVIGTFAGNVITFGTPLVFSSATTSTPCVAMISEGNSFMVAYGITGHGNAIVGTIGGTLGNVITFGTAVAFNSGTVTNISIAIMSTSLFTISYVYNGCNQIAGTISTRTISIGSSVQSASGGTPGVNYTLAFPLTSSSFIAFSLYSVYNYLYSSYSTISGNSISQNLTMVADPSLTVIPKAYRVTDSIFLISYYDTSRLTIVFGTISGTTITFGTPTSISFAYSSASLWDICVLGYGSFILTYANNSNLGFAVLGTISGSSITLGTPVQFSTSTATTLSIYLLTSTSFIISYLDVPQHGCVIVGTITGTVLAFGTAVYYMSSNTTSNVSLTLLSATTFAVIYQQSSQGYAIIGSVAGTVITFGTPVQFYSSGTPNYTSLAMLTSTSFIILFTDGSSQGNVQIGTIAGTVITFGTAVIYNTTGFSTPSVSTISSSQFVIAYLGYVVTGIVSNNNIITIGTPQQYTTLTVGYSAIATLPSTTGFAISFRDTSSNLYFVTGSVAGMLVTVGSVSQVLSGVSNYTAFCILNGYTLVSFYLYQTWGWATVGVFEIATPVLGLYQGNGFVNVIGQQCASLSGLIPGLTYYFNTNTGNGVTTFLTPFKAGQALSPNLLLLSGNA